MEGGEGRRAGGERSSRLSALQEQLVWSLLGSGLSKELLIQAMGDLERERTSAGAERMDRADGESSEEGDMDNPPLIFRELERLPPEEAARQRAEVDQLLQEDSWHVAKMMKTYMQQHNLPQREVVESTGLNQSHLSQHLNKGTPMKNQKRAALYSWYVKKQAEINQQFTNASRGVMSGEESGDDVRKGRRNRFKWGPASQQILFQAYERQKNPSKEEREGLVEECNSFRAECLQRGVPPSQLAGLGYNLVTEVRVYNWFANRRKEEAFRHKLALDVPYSSQSAPLTGQMLPSSPLTVLKYSQPVVCESLGTVRSSGGEDRGHLASPVQLEPSHTLLDTHHHKSASGGGSLPPVSTLTSLHGVSGSSATPPGLIMPSVMSLGDSSLFIGLTSSQPQTVINNVGGGFTTLQPISFQQQLHTSAQQPIVQQLQSHIGPSSFMATMAQLPCHMYSKADLSSYPSSSLLSQAMVIADSNSIGTLTNLTALRQQFKAKQYLRNSRQLFSPQIFTSDPEGHAETPIEEESLHLQSTSPEPVSSGSLDLYPQTQTNETHPSHLLSSPPGDIDPYITQMVSTAQ
ncbi:hepatocyte nuclear factor 1-alpha isoform X1 [Sinocyclocheilus grahami]|uniref:hepatocyte nuclear factor 1-alpha isoform X1 n=1 Tax=Sinocyclocheilus grahami TaxID=75366 RepID=UPI0007AC62E0|nr:PREDICTED: hepatocyte nuclear factor 1-alpha isoform X1 [Sinocyclocheilus grahami]